MGVTKRAVCRVRGHGKGPGLREDRPVTLPGSERTELREFFP